MMVRQSTSMRLWVVIVVVAVVRETFAKEKVGGQNNVSQRFKRDAISDAEFMLFMQRQIAAQNNDPDQWFAVSYVPTCSTIQANFFDLQSRYTGGTLTAVANINGDTDLPDVTKSEIIDDMYQIDYTDNLGKCDTLNIVATISNADGSDSSEYTASTHIDCKCGEGKGAGDPHYDTIDGLKVTFQGEHCSYIIVKDGCKENQKSTFEVLAVHGGEEVSRVRKIIGIAVKLGKDVMLLGKDLTRLNNVNVSRDELHLTGDGEIEVYHQDGWFIVQALKGRWYAKWSDEHRFVFGIHPDSPLAGQICGLLGDANGDKTNDFTMPNGLRASDGEALGASWKDPKCEYVDQFIDF